MDGEAVCTALASCPGPDCLKDIIKKAGPRLRVYSALRSICLEAEPVSYMIMFYVTVACYVAQFEKKK